MAVDETHIRALKNLFVAQRFYPDKYEQFKKNLAISDIPFAFSNPKFLDALIVFSHSFETFLKEQKELPAPPEVMDAVAPRVLIESILQNAPVITSEIDKAKQQRLKNLVPEFARKVQGMARVKDMPELEKRLFTEFSGIIAKNPREFGEKMELAFARVIATAAQSEKFGSQAKQIAKEVLQKSKRELDVITAPDPSEEIITEAMMKSPARKDLWLETYIKLSAIDPSPKFEVVDRLALVAEALQATPPKEVTYNIFSRVDVGGLQKPIQGVLGAVVSVIPNAREKIIASGWSAATNLEKTQERFGRLITESPIYTRALERGNRVFGGRARNFVWDLASSIAGPPVAADVFVLEILGLAPESYSMVQVQAANSHSRSPGFFGLVFSEAAGWGLQKGVAAVAKKTGWKVGAGLGARFGSLFGGIFGALIGGFFGGGLGSLFGKKQPGPPKKWYQTEFALAAGLVLLPILLIVVLMSMKMIAEFGTFNEQRARRGTPEPGSAYIAVTKTPSKTSFQNGEAQTVEYTVTVEATEKNLQNVSITDCISVYPGSTSCKPQGNFSDITNLSLGKSYTKTYSVSISGLQDALLVNTVRVTAQTDTTKPGEKEEKTTSSTITIGSPKIDVAMQGAAGFSPGGWCDKDGPSVAWKPEEWAKVMGAFASFPAPFMALVQQSNPGGITIYRINWSGNYWGCTDSTGGKTNIYIYNGGIPNMTYILAHELGHTIEDNDGWFSLFKSMAAPEGATRYASGYSDPETRLSEDFAETIALYIVYPESLKSSLPLHYAFAACLFSGGPALTCQ